MEALKAIKIIGNQNDGRAVFLFFQIPGTKGFKGVDHSKKSLSKFHLNMFY